MPTCTFSRSNLGSVETDIGRSAGSNTKDSGHINLPKDTNLRILTAFKAAVDYGTESWLKGIKPGKEPDKNCTKTVKYFLKTSIFIGMIEQHEKEVFYWC